MKKSNVEGIEPEGETKQFALKEIPSDVHLFLKVKAAKEDISMNTLILKAVGEFYSEEIKEFNKTN